MAVTYKRGGEKLEAVNIRLTAKEKFTLELAARQAGKSQAAFVVECLREKFRDEHGSLMVTPPDSDTQAFLQELVWHPVPADRITNLCVFAPSLLSDQELLLWTVIKENTKYWDGRKPNYRKIRDNWSEITAEAERIGDQES